MEQEQLLLLLGWGHLLLLLGAFLLLWGLLFLLRWPSNVFSSRPLPTNCQVTVVLVQFVKKNGQVTVVYLFGVQFLHLLQLLASGMS